MPPCFPLLQKSSRPRRTETTNRYNAALLTIILLMDSNALIQLARMPMPFGKYQGRVLIDLPEEYLLWFRDKGFPKGQLGELLALALEIRINGQESLLQPLRTQSPYKGTQ